MEPIEPPLDLPLVVLIVLYAIWLSRSTKLLPAADESDFQRVFICHHLDI